MNRMHLAVYEWNVSTIQTECVQHSPHPVGVCFSRCIDVVVFVIYFVYLEKPKQVSSNKVTQQHALHTQGESRLRDIILAG